MLFEPAAMSRSSSGEAGRPNDRLNVEAMIALRIRYADGSQSIASDMRRLVGGDEMFNTPAEVADAYAIAWLMMYFLSERKPSQFAALLNHTAARPAFEDYSPDDRIADFSRIVGRSIEDTVADIKAFMPFLR